MFSSAVWLVGLLSLSISALATFEVTKRKRVAAQRPRNFKQGARPLVLPLLVHEDNSPGQWGLHRNSGGRGSQRCIAIQPPPPYPRLKTCSNVRHGQRDSLPPYVAPSAHKKLPIEKELCGATNLGGLPLLAHVPVPLPTVSKSQENANRKANYNSEELGAERPVLLEALEVQEVGSSPGTRKSLDSRDSFLSWTNRQSTSSFATAFDDGRLDSSSEEGPDSFQRLGVVIGSGRKLQGQCGILTKLASIKKKSESSTSLPELGATISPASGFKENSSVCKEAADYHSVLDHYLKEF